jgi:hypothetical protein
VAEAEEVAQHQEAAEKKTFSREKISIWFSGVHRRFSRCALIVPEEVTLSYVAGSERAGDTYKTGLAVKIALLKN